MALKITVNPSGCDPAPGLLHHHAVRLVWPDGSKCDLMIVAIALRPGSSHAWACSIGSKARTSMGHALGDALAMDMSSDPLMTMWGKMAGLRRALADAEADASAMRRERDQAKAERDAFREFAAGMCKAMLSDPATPEDVRSLATEALAKIGGGL